MSKRDNPPARIWLQWYQEGEGGYDEDDEFAPAPGDITWCGDRIYTDDICYVRAGKSTAALMEEIAEQQAQYESALALVDLYRPGYRRAVETNNPRSTVGEDDRDELQSRRKRLDNLVRIQCEDGNWNFDPYMHGMANGLLVAQAVMYDSEHFEALSAPDKWLSTGEQDKEIIRRMEDIEQRLTAVHIGFGELREHLEPLLEILKRPYR